MILLLLLMEFTRVTYSYYLPDRRVPSTSVPCLFPQPQTTDFDIFCQSDYHKIPYMCDPTGSLSRTEAELLDETVRSLNMTSCFCGSTCNTNFKTKLGIVVIPNATVADMEVCDVTVDHAITKSSMTASAFQYGAILSQHWSNQCNADLMLLYIRIFVSERVMKPFIVPIYGNGLRRLQRYSRPQAISVREPVFSALQFGLRHSTRLKEADIMEANNSIPSWAKWTVAGMVAIVFLAFYIANCVTNKRSQKQKSSISSVRKSSDRFRAGFGGGMIMNSSQQKKSVMMFRTFSKTPRNNGANRL